MPGQIVPITDLAKAGVVIDTPSVSLPPNVFSNVQNIRFHDNAIKKMEGEATIAISGLTDTDWIYTAWWPHPDLAPTDGYYIIVSRSTEGDIVDTIHIVRASDLEILNEFGSMTSTAKGSRMVEDTSKWQHTLFGGSRALVMNNGTSTPLYIIDPDNNDFLDLPGWDSYLVDENVTNVTWNGFAVTDQGISLGQNVDISNSLAVLVLNGIIVGESYFVSTPNNASTAQWIEAGALEPGTAAGILPDIGTRFVAAINGDAITGLLSGNAVYRQGTQEVIMTVVEATGDISPFTYIFNDLTEVPEAPGTLEFDPETGVHYLTPKVRVLDPTDPTVVTQQGVTAGDQVVITVRTTPLIRVRARVVRSFGNLLVAGNLTEVRRDDPTQMVRNMPGVIRTSDVAPAGAIPANWNPFSVGVNTADEFTLSSTGIVQDMAELQGVLYVYTNSSIHAIQQTGNSALPFNIRPVTFGYGCQNIDSVLEFDGKHIVVGSNDIYVFAGHPGSISSIADSRVREYFFSNLSSTHADRLFILVNRRFDEVWICYPRDTPLHSTNTSGLCDEVLVWNYRDNTWTIRRMSAFYNGVIVPRKINPDGDSPLDPNVLVPLFTAINVIFEADADGYTQSAPLGLQAGIGYESFVERDRLALTPEFDTETLASIAVLADSTIADPPTLSLEVRGTSRPGDGSGVTDALDFSFDIGEAYKTDVRIQGRFLNYKIGDTATNTDPWRLSGMQYEIMKGGSR